MPNYCLNKILLRQSTPALRRTILFCFIISCFSVFGQGNQSEYLEAKRQFSIGNYRDAMGSFQSLTEDKVFGPYASFYYGLSAYHQELPKVALDMWKQTLAKFPEWDQRDEVTLWIAKLSFEKKRYLEGIQYANRLPDDQQELLIVSLEEGLDVNELKGLHESNQENEALARLYFKALADQPFESRDNEALIELSKKFDFEIAEVLNEFPLVKKDSYAVALVLPFMFDSLQNPQSVIANGIIFDLYQGMQLARDSLAASGIDLRLFPFDTKKVGYKTREIVRSGSLKDADVIIGPLYQEPNQLISIFSKENEIPIINPLSSNGNVINDNRYAYLFKPSYDTQGKKAGEYAAKTFTRNKRAMILFETERDQVVAEAYKTVLEADSFEIVLYDQLTDEYARQLQADFTEQYEEVLDSLSQEAIDSIALIPNRFVRSRIIRDEETGRILNGRDGEDSVQYYEVKFVIPTDTIGHIFAATSSNLLANNVISLTEVRGDSISIMGYSDWLRFRLVSYNQLERLGVSMIHSSFINEAAELVAEKIRKVFATEPSIYHMQGFELIMQLGKLFNDHGKYFQRGLVTGDYLDGFLMEGLTFGPYSDNQVVPIVRIDGLQLKVQNRDQYED